jgi:hypothetical protein
MLPQPRDLRGAGRAGRRVTAADEPLLDLTTPEQVIAVCARVFPDEPLIHSCPVGETVGELLAPALERNIPHPTFAFPTAVARCQNKLLVVSAQFDTKGSPAAVSGTSHRVALLGRRDFG